jgi:tryptophan-rich sensory protein
VWESIPAEKRRRVMTPYFVQLALNALWSPVFFMLQQPGWALGVIIAMLSAIIWNIRTFRDVHRVAAGLLVPYACWVSFATVLNATLWHLN